MEKKLRKRTELQNKRYKNLDNDTRGNWKSSDLSVKTYSKAYDYPITTPSGKIINPPQGRCWRTSKENLENLIRENRIYFGKNGDNVPSIKRFLTEVQDGTVPVTLWLRDEVGDNQEARQALKKIFSEREFPFDTPKPSRLIEKILQISTNKNDIILDSFAGSGTTAHAVLNLNKQDGGNRKFILIEMEEYAETITAERVKRVMNGYADIKGTNGSFDYYALGHTLFDENHELNEEVPSEKIRSYLWYTETQTAYIPAGIKLLNRNPYFLGMKNDTAYYFHWHPGKATSLNPAWLKHLIKEAQQHVVYADNCTLNKPQLLKYNIIFKKIPRDITKF